MTIKNIKQYYSINKWIDNAYFLFDLDQSKAKRMNHKYLCSIKKNGSKFTVEGKEVKNIEELQKAVNDYVNSLEYNSEYYFPAYRKGTFEEFIIHDYLNDLGFKYNGDDVYTSNNKNIYNISNPINIKLKGLDSLKPLKTINICLNTGKYSWVETSCKRNVKSIKNAIDSLLKPLYISNSKINLDNSVKLTNFSKIENMSLNQIKNYAKFETDIKDKLILELEGMLENLKA